MSSLGASDDGCFDRETTCDVEFEWADGDGAAVAVVNVAAALTDQKPTAMEPLNNVINTDALNSVFAPTEDEPRRSGVVEFSYEGCHIRLRSDGTVSAVQAE